MERVGIPPASPAPRLCARLRGPASFGISGPAADAPRPPALYVAYPVPFVTAQAGTLAPTDAENQGLSLRSQEFVLTVFSQMRVAGIRRSQGRRKIFVRTVFSISFFVVARLAMGGGISYNPPRFALHRARHTDYPRGEVVSSRSRRRVWVASRENLRNFLEKAHRRSTAFVQFRLLRCIFSGSSQVPLSVHRGRCFRFHHRPDV